MSVTCACEPEDFSLSENSIFTDFKINACGESETMHTATDTVNAATV